MSARGVEVRSRGPINWRVSERVDCEPSSALVGQTGLLPTLLHQGSQHELSSRKFSYVLFWGGGGREENNVRTTRKQ